MEAKKEEHVLKDEIPVHRRDVKKMIQRHVSIMDQLRSDIAVWAQAYAQAGKDEYVKITMAYLDTLDVCKTVLEYLQDCQTVGIERAKTERSKLQGKGGE